MNNEQRLLNIITSEDACIQEIQDHGFAGGVSGFIYHNELRQKYMDNADAFNSYLDYNEELFEAIMEQVKTHGMNSLFDYIVWGVLEEIANNADADECECSACEELREEFDNVDEEEDVHEYDPEE